MNNDDEILQELSGDTLKTTAKAFGNRLGNAALATAGSYIGRGGEAQGRLDKRIVADRMLQGWLQYKGSTGQQPTRQNVYQFLRKHFGRKIGDPELRSITGMPSRPEPPDRGAGGSLPPSGTPPGTPPGSAPTGDPSATPGTPPGTPGTPPGATPPAAGTPSAPPATVAPTEISMDTLKASAPRDAKGHSDASAMTRKFHKTIADAVARGDKVFLTGGDVGDRRVELSSRKGSTVMASDGAPVGFVGALSRVGSRVVIEPSTPAAEPSAETPATTTSTPPPEPITAEPAPTPAAPAAPLRIRTIADIMKQDGVSAAAANDKQQKEVEAYAAAQAAAKKAAAPATPTPSTNATTSVPTSAAPTPPLQAPQAPAAPQVPQQPTNAPQAAVRPPQAQQMGNQAAPATNTAAPGQQKVPTGVDWPAFKKQMNGLIQVNQPNQPANQTQVMQLLAKTLGQTVKGSKDRERMVNYINGLRTNWIINRKIPQLKEIPLESYLPRGGRLLREAEDAAEDVLKRSDLDKIFVKVSQALFANSAASSREDDGDDYDGDDDETDGHDAEDDFDTLGDRFITMKKLRQAIIAIKPSPRDMRLAGKIITDKVQEMTDKNPRVTLKQLLRALKNDDRKIERMPSDIHKILLYAAKMKD